jgi:hypothetical protein
MEENTTLDRWSARAALIGRVERGEISPSEAETEALDQGISPLLPRPDPADPQYDPMQIPAWSLLMATAWVAFRDVAVVRSSWNLYVTAQWQWVPQAPSVPSSILPPPATSTTPQPLRRPHTMARRRPSNLHSFSSSIWNDDFHGTRWEGASVTDAYRLLVQAMARGDIATQGRDLRVGVLADVAQIPAGNWTVLKLGEWRQPYGNALMLGEVGPDMLHFGDGSPVYVDVSIDRRQLMAAFPATESPAENDTPVAFLSEQREQLTDHQKRARTEDHLAEEITRLIEASPQVITHTRAVLLPMARELGLSARALDRSLAKARARVPGNSWNKGGRTTKSRGAETSAAKPQQ